MPLIIGAKSASASTGVANSCRFNKPDDANLSRTQGAPTEAKNFTISVWTKRGNMGDLGGGDYPAMMSYYLAADTARGNLSFGSDDKLNFNSNPTGSSWLNIQVTDRVFRDPSAWYNIVVAVDTTAVEANRAKIWVNGTLQTLNNTIGTGDMDLGWSVNTHTHEVGREATVSGGTNEFDGYMAEVCFIDGTTYAASDFGEFDEDSPIIWKPKDVSGLTFGNNGFYLNFEDSADLGADASGNSNDLTENNLDATDQATDTPANNFATWNPLIYGASSLTLENGNNEITAVADTDYHSIYGTIPVSTGKWYWEMKAVNVDSASNRMSWGIGDIENVQNANPGEVGDKSNGWTWDSAGGYKTGGSGGQDSSDYTTYTTGDILMFALDCDNAKLYLGNNGTWENSGDPTSGATGTGAISITADTIYAPAGNIRYASNQAAINFGGSPGFTVSSANQDADGYGNFEYAVPSGYYALCTKNLGAYGG